MPSGPAELTRVASGRLTLQRAVARMRILSVQPGRSLLIPAARGCCWGQIAITLLIP